MAQAPRQSSNSADLAVIKQILESVQTAVKDIPEIQRNIAVMAANFEQVREDVAAHDLALNGNGKPGLKADVKEIKDWKGGINKFIWMVITPFVAFSVALGIYLLVTFGGKITP